MSERVKVYNEKARSTFTTISELRGGWMNDITLACPEGELKANQSILISNCKTIKSILRQHVGFEQPYIYFADQSMRIINLMLQYLYQGTVNIVVQSESHGFLKLAEDLQIQGVVIEQALINQTREKIESEMSLTRKSKDPEVVEDSMTTKYPIEIQEQSENQKINQYSTENSILMELHHVKQEIEDPKAITDLKPRKRLGKRVLRNPIHMYYKGDKLRKLSECLQCGRVMTNLNPTNLTSHIKSFHPKQYDEFKIRYKEEAAKYSQKKLLPLSESDSNQTASENLNASKALIQDDSVETLINDFYESFDNISQCKECGRVMAIHDSSSLVQHVKTLHSSIYQVYSGRYCDSAPDIRIQGL